ncbi:MAG: hypothetical protein ACRDRO_22080 [Pseudonocardiaceae bacterium]
MAVSLVRVVAPTAATALVGSIVVVVVTLATTWTTTGWAWLLAVAGLTVISSGVSWWLHTRQARTDSVPRAGGVSVSGNLDTHAAHRARIETGHRHEGVGTRAAAAVVIPLTGEDEPCRGSWWAAIRNSPHCWPCWIRVSSHVRGP